MLYTTSTCFAWSKRARQIFLILAFAFAFNISSNYAQMVFVKGTPSSLQQKNISDIPTISLPKLDYDKLAEEDALDTQNNKPVRFGYLHELDKNLNNSGQWEVLKNGDRIWRLRIHAPEANTTNLNYNKFDLPKGGRLYIYNDSRSEVLGPFTNFNEKENGEFATGFVRGTHCTIEYYEPAEYSGQGQIEISGLVHGYKSVRSKVDDILKDFQGSGGCNNDVECAIGNGWEDQIKSVGLILLANNTRWCTGALINTTANNCQAYFLTADHCFSNNNPGDVLNTIFMFNYHSPTPACPGIPTTDGPLNQTVQGATIVANASDSDFCLMEITNNPNLSYDVFFSGWDRTNIAAQSAAGIHHPDGDVKKISFENNAIINDPSDPNRYWQVTDWDQGTTEPGSSGSPLFDQSNKRIVGQLFGGTAACSGNSNNGSPDFYGKVSYSWDQVGNNNTQQLKPWLDPINSGVMTMNGSDCASSPVANFSPTTGTNFTYCSNGGDIQFQDLSSSSPSSWTWSFSGAGVSPTSSTLQNPLVSVSSSGTLTATLTVSNSMGNDSKTHSYPISISTCVTNTYCDVPALAIPDNNATGISSSITVPTSSTLSDINIEVDISHTWVGDLIIDISHGGITQRILDRPGNCNQANIMATFDDEATLAAETMCNTGGIAIGGDVIPNNPLSVFDGIDPTGVWTITVSDNAGQDLGTLNTWCIEATTAGSICPNTITHANGLLQTETGIADYEASNLISTTAATVINSGAIVDYDAAIMIELNAPFEVQVGAVFEAFIDGCNNGAGGSNIVDETSEVKK